MSTRYLTVVVSGGETKVAQYGQCDGYPSWAGARILGFLSNANNIEKLKKSLRKVRFLSKRIDRNTMDMGGPGVDYEFAANEKPDLEGWIAEFFSRRVGWRILKRLCEPFGSEVFLNNDIAFAGDSALCKYVYVIDFDSDFLEVYSGSNKHPVLSGRFLSSDSALDRGPLEPVKLIKTYELKNLPDEAVFIKEVGDE